MKDFNFQLFGVLRGSTLRFDGSPLLYLTFYSNLTGRGVTDLTLKILLLICSVKNFKRASHHGQIDLNKMLGTKKGTHQTSQGTPLGPQITEN